MARRAVWRREPNRRPSRRRRKPRGRPSGKPRGRRSSVRPIHATASNSPSVGSYPSARFCHQRRDAAVKRPADKVDDEGVGDVEGSRFTECGRAIGRSVGLLLSPSGVRFSMARRSGEGEQHTSPGIREVPERRGAVPVVGREYFANGCILEHFADALGHSSWHPFHRRVPAVLVPIHLFCLSARGRLPGQRRLIAVYANR
jgi:hypothetical protein